MVGGNAIFILARKCEKVFHGLYVLGGLFLLRYLPLISFSRSNDCKVTRLNAAGAGANCRRDIRWYQFSSFVGGVESGSPISVSASRRCSPQRFIASRTGSNVCPKGVNPYSTLVGTSA